MLDAASPKGDAALMPGSFAVVRATKLLRRCEDLAHNYDISDAYTYCRYDLLEKTHLLMARHSRAGTASAAESVLVPRATGLVEDNTRTHFRACTHQHFTTELRGHG